MTAGPVAPVAPAAASAVFGDRIDVLVAYAELLATVGVERGLIGPRETPRLWERHLLNCAGPAELLAPGETVLDLGSGAGLPGLVLAAARPDLHVVLVEPMLRRASFLTEAVDLLGLDQVVVRRSRAEELVDVFAVDVVVARAVAPVDRLAGWGLPLLRPGGRLLALKGERAADELAAAAGALTRLGGTGARVVEVGEEHLATWARVVVIERGTPLSRGGVRPAPRAATRTGQPQAPRRTRPGRAGLSARAARGAGAHRDGTAGPQVTPDVSPQSRARSAMTDEQT